MDRKKLVLLLGALIVAVGTAFAARSMFMGSAAPQVQAQIQQEPEGPKVLVANRALPAGTIITADAMGFQQWPEELVQDAYFIEGESDMEQLLGTVVRFPVTAGEPVTQGSLVSPGDRGFLAAALGPGMRAVTLPVSARTGVAGFVFPGDRVDVVLTQTVEGEGRPLRVGETVMQDLRVLATDQTTEQTQNEEGKTEVRAFQTVTLEVNPAAAERLTVAQTIGTLTLVLRSIADNQVELDRMIASGDVNIPEGATAEEEEQILRAAMNRRSKRGSSFQTGGDVSRFQRKTLPEEEEAAAARREAARRAAQVAQEAALARARAAGRNLTGKGFSGPVVRVIRGTNASETPIGANGQAVATEQAKNVGQTGGTLGAVAKSGLVK
ncbi:MAG: Flp pilus assembly protein CpaB [Pseudomonadota bacterium]